MVVFPCAQSTNTGSDRYTDPLRIDILTDHKSAVLQRIFSGSHGKLDKTVHLARFLAAKPRLWIKVFDCRCNLGSVLTDIKGIYR
ncbi:hypothetical protein D3C73_867240 [compost metagenome]